MVSNYRLDILKSDVPLSKYITWYKVQGFKRVHMWTMYCRANLHWAIGVAIGVPNIWRFRFCAKMKVHVLYVRICIRVYVCISYVHAYLPLELWNLRAIAVHFIYCRRRFWLKWAVKIGLIYLHKLIIDSHRRRWTIPGPRSQSEYSLC